jgi:hypothetical protein
MPYNTFPYLTIDGGTSGNTYYTSAYALSASGGYTLTQQFPTITLAKAPIVSSYSLVNAVQVRILASEFYNLLGTFNSATNMWANDSVTLGANSFKNAVVAVKNSYSDISHAIVSVGYFSNVYSDYTNYVNNYFGAEMGSINIFGAGVYFSYKPNGDTGFGSTDFYNLLTGSPGGTSPNYGSYPDVSGGITGDIGNATLPAAALAAQTTYPSIATAGSITISDINNTLHYVANNDIFGNRSTAPDFNNTDNKSISSGFIPGDLIYIPNGIEIVLDLQILPGVNPTPSNWTTTTVTTQNIIGGGVSYTESSMDELLRVYTAPLLIELI